MARASDKLSILRGTLDLLILQAVAERARHGFEITTWLEAGAEGAFTLDVDDSALYQALHRLEARGRLRGEWGVSANNRRARYYHLTRAGRAYLAGERTRLLSYAKTITTLLSPARGK